MQLQKALLAVHLSESGWQVLEDGTDEGLDSNCVEFPWKTNFCEARAVHKGKILVFLLFVCWKGQHS